VAIARRVEPRKWHIKVWVLSTSLWSLKWLQRVAWSMSSVFVTSEFEVATARGVEPEFCLCRSGVCVTSEFEVTTARRVEFSCTFHAP
jgi:hypothetical protein